ncbi:MAG: hypothetical protein CVU05_09550 [Bacteroidetes bacterium HGW-Bacteroidetes-21]|jgi:gliding motility-associated-like protein|nr:MAG: hypothetical protein CVU05_09550 [Bacteroidetes bacterium HGW-Bacteroidetes-21]
MNKLTPNEKLLQEKLNAFEYPYQDNAWMQFDKALQKHRLFKTLRWVAGVTLFTAAVITIWVAIPEKSPITENSNKITEHSVATSNNVTEVQEIQNETPDNSSVSQTMVSNNSTQTSTSETVNKNTIIKNQVSLKDTTKTCNNLTTITPSNKAKSPCPDFTISQTSGCPPFEAKFFPVEKCDSMIYSWDFGDGKISTERSPEHTYTRQGKYQVKLMVKYFKNEEIKVKIIEQAITVFSKPKANFDIEIDNQHVLLSSENTEKLIWQANDTTSYGLSAERTYKKNGQYSVSLVAQNSFGCMDTLTKKINIKIPLLVQLPNAIRPDGDGVNDIFEPITDNQNITNYHMEIINSRGQVMYSGTGKKVGWNGSCQSNNQPCEPGMYLYKLKAWDNNGNYESYQGSVSIIK